MPTETVSNVKRHLGIVIKKFKFEELENTVLPNFPEITWNEMRTKLIKHHESFTVKSVLRFIEDIIDRAKLRQEDLWERLLTLETIEVSRHSNKRVWYGYALIGSTKAVNYFELKRIQDKIRRNFLQINMEMEVKILTYDGITYICLKEKPKRRSLRISLPIYFALFPRQKYMFCSRKTASKNVTHTIATTIGYTSCKQLKLMGRDLRSLLKLLWNKEQCALNTKRIKDPPVYMDAEPVVKSTGIDYTQRLQRKNYAEQCFGVNPPVLEGLTINAPGQTWKHQEMSEKLPDEINLGWEFRSHNIVSFLAKLTERRILATPLPPYITNLMVLGKNQLTLRENESL